MKSKKVTYKQLMDYIEQLEMQVKNNQQAVYDVSGLLNEYVEIYKVTEAYESAFWIRC